MSAEGVQFREEFQRLMRALYDSLEREGELQRQLRRTKETLISVALRLQVAIKVSAEDELTIASLQQQAAESRTKEILANRNAQEAAEMVGSLNFEINQLRRKLKISEAEKPGATVNSANEIYQMSYAAADAEVDQMLSENTSSFPATKFVDRQQEMSATPFEKWKMNHFLFSPDTPAASEEHDKAVVQMLLEASAAQFHDDFRKPTKSGIAKMKRSSSHGTGLLQPLGTSHGNRTHLTSTTEGGANVYETVGVNLLDTLDLPPFSAVGGARRGQDEKIYFLDKAASTAMWGTNMKSPGKPLGIMGTAREELHSRGGMHSQQSQQGHHSSDSGGLSPLKNMRLQSSHSPERGMGGGGGGNNTASGSRTGKSKGINSMII
eukprot:gene17696-20157_t